MNRSPEERYVIKPFTGSSHSWVLNELESLPKESTILDIGPGSGLFGRLLGEAGFSEMDCVEIDREALEMAKEVYNEAVENEDQLSRKQYDVLLLLDVLEHMTEPFDYLERILKFAKPGATVFVSVPNVAHWGVRLPLLFGFFEYTQRGLLDKSHYQFFNRRRFKKLINTPSKITVEKIASSIPPAELVLPDLITNNALYRLGSHVHVLTAQILPGFFAYQHLARLKKS